MSDPGNPVDGVPNEEPVDRRWLLRTSGLLGVAAGAVAAGAAGAGAAAATPAPPAGAPEVPGAFGQPPSVHASHGVGPNSAGGTSSRVGPGIAAGPEVSAAAGTRLAPSKTVIDTTPLAQRTTGGVHWSTEA